MRNLLLTVLLALGLNSWTSAAPFNPDQVAAEPQTEYFVRVGNYNHGSSGDYSLTVKMQ